MAHDNEVMYLVTVIKINMNRLWVNEYVIILFDICFFYDIVMWQITAVEISLMI